jgi:hypothetical protein
MVVGPEAAGSLLVGTVVKSSVDNGRAGEDDDEVNFIIFPFRQLRPRSCPKSRHAFICTVCLENRQLQSP